MAADMNTKPEPKEFLACVVCGEVVMRIHTYKKKKKEKNTPVASSKHRLNVTLGRLHDDEGMIMHINMRMIESWYVYTALTRLVGETIEVYERGNDTIKLINRDEFIHTGRETYELTIIEIRPDEPKDANALTFPHLVTGFF
jgi:hypothetical protein